LKLIGFVGMPGSGKSEASRLAKEMGIQVVVMGDVIRQEAARQGLAPTDENLGRIGNMLRQEEGSDAIARRTLSLVGNAGADLAVIDGLRSKAEADFFRSHVDQFLLVEVWTPPEARLRRVAARGRSDDGNSENQAEALLKRDCRELGWGMNEAIREADVRVENKGNLEELRRSVQSILNEFKSGRK